MNREIKEGIVCSGVSFGSAVAAGCLDKASKNAKDEGKKTLLSILEVIALGVAAVTGGIATHRFQSSAKATYRQLAISKVYCGSISA